MLILTIFPKKVQFQKIFHFWKWKIWGKCFKMFSPTGKKIFSFGKIFTYGNFHSNFGCMLSQTIPYHTKPYRTNLLCKSSIKQPKQVRFFTNFHRTQKIQIYVVSNQTLPNQTILMKLSQKLQMDLMTPKTYDNCMCVRQTDKDNK